MAVAVGYLGSTADKDRIFAIGQEVIFGKMLLKVEEIWDSSQDSGIKKAFTIEGINVKNSERVQVQVVNPTFIHLDYYKMKTLS